MMRTLLFAAAFCSMALSWSATAETGANDIPVLEIGFDEHGLSGPGGETLRKEIEEAQFVSLGEDHGFADAPQLATGLAAEMQKRGKVYHAAEIGTHSADLVGRALEEDGIAGLAGLLDGKPLSLPFLSNREDAELALGFEQDKSGIALWGIDQEFLGSPLLLLEELKALAPDDAARVAAQAVMQRDYDALTSGKQNELLLFSATAGDFAALRGKFAGTAQAEEIIDALAESAAIYQHNNSKRYFSNNFDRNALMRRLFLDQYHAADEEAPRVLLKMGAFHVGRGTSPTSMYDIGSMLPGLAAANKKTSLHIAFSGLAGEQLVIRPSADGFTAVQPVDDKIITPILEAAGVDMTRIGDSGHYLIPLDPIRRKLQNKGINDLSRFAKFVLLGFDYIVTTKDAKAATPLVK